MFQIMNAFKLMNKTLDSATKFEESNTNKIGRKNKIYPSLIDRNPVFKAEVLEILDAVIAAIATGGVINDSTPQYSTYKCAASGSIPP